MVPKPGASQIVDALIPLVMEEIIEAVRRIPHERIRQRIVEETVRADTSCAGAGIVADSVQLAFESNPVVRADPADAVKSLAATLASEVASKNRCAHVTADHEVSVEMFADELQVLAETTHVPGSETCATGGHAWPLSQPFHRCVHDGRPQSVRRDEDDEASRPQGALCCSSSARLSCHGRNRRQPGRAEGYPWWR